jgi:hypothetical protein
LEHKDLLPLTDFFYYQCVAHWKVTCDFFVSSTQMVNEITTVVFNHGNWSFSILKIIMQFLFLHFSKYFRKYCNWPVYFIVLSLW